MSSPSHIVPDPHFQPFRSFEDVKRWPVQLGKLMADPMIGAWVDPDRLEAFISDEYDRLRPSEAAIANAEVRFARMQNGGQE